MADMAVKSTAMKSLGGVLARQGILVAFIVFMVGFTLWNPRFHRHRQRLRRGPVLGDPRVMALGVTFVVIGGNLDLSVGSMLSFSTIVVLDLHDNPAFGPALAIPACSR
jgi:ribose/xylose/arabinose/galactoside ABC-type transport system permease subunit